MDAKMRAETSPRGRQGQCWRPTTRRSSATAANRVRGRRSTPSADRATRRSGSSRHAALEAGGIAQMPVMSKGPERAAGAHDQADRDPRDHTLQVGTPG
jgi:hypothetical protein